MNLREAMAFADELRPNTVDEVLKSEWMKRLEGELAETIQVDLPEWVWPEDQELLMPEPVDILYIYFLCSMIDWAQLDTQLYQVDKAMYDSAYAQALAWWRRHNRPRVSETGARIE